MIQLYEEATQENGIVKDTQIFTDAYVPRYVLYRDSEMDFLTQKYGNVFRGVPLRNIVLVGGAGSGKTLITSCVLSDVKDQCDSSHISFDYHIINCNNFDTIFKILTHFLRVKGFIDKIRWDRTLAINKFKDYLTDYQYIVIVLDEFDQFFFKRKGEADQFLYLCSRALPQVSLHLISQNYKIMFLNNELTPGTADTFRFDTVTFNPYSFDDLCAILTDRMRIGMDKSAWSPALVEKIVGTVHIVGRGVRGILDICRKLISYTRSIGATEILPEYVDTVVTEVRDEQTVKSILALPVPIRAILFYMWQRKDPQDLNSISAWFAELVKDTEFHASKMTFHRYVTQLAMMGIISKRRQGMGIVLGIEPTFLPAVEKAYRRYETSLTGI